MKYKWAIFQINVREELPGRRKVGKGKKNLPAQSCGMHCKILDMNLQSFRFPVMTNLNKKRSVKIYLTNLSLTSRTRFISKVLNVAGPTCTGVLYRTSQPGKA